MAEAETQKPAPVVTKVKAKKIKIDGKKIAYWNAFAISGSIFFGVAIIFNAIASLITSQTKGEWYFGVPFSGLLTSWSNAFNLPSEVILAALVLGLGIFAVTTVNKITDAEALKKAWKCNAKIFLGLTTLYALSLVLICIYSIMNIQKGAGEFQKDLWLSGFLSTLIMGGVAGFIGVVSLAIAKGKTVLVRIMSYIAVSVASLAFMMMFIERIVTIHSSKSTSTSELKSLWDALTE